MICDFNLSSADQFIVELNIFTKVVIHRKTRNGFVKNLPGPYGPFDGVVPNNLNPATAELDLIDSKGFKLNIY